MYYNVCRNPVLEQSPIVPKAQLRLYRSIVGVYKCLGSGASGMDLWSRNPGWDWYRGERVEHCHNVGKHEAAWSSMKQREATWRFCMLMVSQPSPPVERVFLLLRTNSDPLPDHAREQARGDCPGASYNTGTCCGKDF